MSLRDPDQWPVSPLVRRHPFSESHQVLRHSLRPIRLNPNRSTYYSHQNPINSGYLSPVLVFSRYSRHQPPRLRPSQPNINFPCGDSPPDDGLLHVPVPLSLYNNNPTDLGPYRPYTRIPSTMSSSNVYDLCTTYVGALLLNCNVDTEPKGNNEGLNERHKRRGRRTLVKVFFFERCSGTES